MPGDADSIRYDPWPLVWVVCVSPVEVDTAVTVAPDTTAPCGSVTAPVMVPLLVWAINAAVAVNKMNKTAKRSKFFILFSPFCFAWKRREERIRVKNRY